ncbi:MAG TPA: ribonuclease E/G [Stellaceae bacterium]|nr:ribonuclease E/G [Stellaceae bacterium]
MGELLIGAGPGEWRAAWLEGGEAREVYVERGDTKPLGSRHLGRVVRVVPALDAAFVDIGDERSGFLPLRDAPAGVALIEGLRLVVEVRREAWQDKAPRLTAKIADPPALPDRLEPPRQLFPAPGLGAALALRLPALPVRVMVDDAAALADLRHVFPTAEIALRSEPDGPADLAALLETALAPSLALADGGSLHLEETRAATMIDIDTGTPAGGSSVRAALAANRQAARLVARELRRRNIGGAVVIDFVGLERRDHREQVRRTLEAALSEDPAKPQLLGWTRLGHLELVRPRRGRSLADAMLEPASRRRQPVAVAYDALRRLQREARAAPAARWRLRAAPSVVMALQGPAAAALRSLEERLGHRIAIDPEAGVESFDIARV